MTDRIDTAKEREKLEALTGISQLDIAEQTESALKVKEAVDRLNSMIFKAASVGVDTEIITYDYTSFSLGEIQIIGVRTSVAL